MKKTSKFKKLYQKSRHRRIRARISGTAERPRLCVFRSNNHIYAQLINDSEGKTLLSASDSAFKNLKKTKTELADMVGRLMAQKAKEKNINEAVFDRAGYAYHGAVKALAEGARSAGLKV